MKTPKTFRMCGSLPLLEAMRSELYELGYKEGERLWDSGNNPIYLSSSWYQSTINTDPEKIKSIYLGWATDIDETVFNLPEQYNEALAFAKEQIEIVNKPALKPGNVGTFDVWKEGGHNWSENKKGDIYQITGIGCARNLNRGRYELMYSVSYSDFIVHCTTLDEAKDASFKILHERDVVFCEDKVVLPSDEGWNVEELETMTSLLKLKAV